MILIVEEELHSAILECAVAAGVVEVEGVSREACFKQLAARQRHGACAAGTVLHRV